MEEIELGTGALLLFGLVAVGLLKFIIIELSKYRDNGE